MTTPSDAISGLSTGSQRAARVPLAPTRPMYWSIRRELWENRSIYIAPLVVAGFMMFTFLASTIGLPHRRRATLLLDPAAQRAAIEKPYDMAAMMIIVTAFIIGFFYCLDALHGERRDRSILFWKSLPVSDLTAVLSKASIPFVVLPALVFLIVMAIQLDMLLVSNVILLANGLPATSAEQLPLVQHSLILLYGLVVLSLWHAPVYAWLLMVSSWARRVVFLWAVLPFIVVSMLEKMTFQTSYFGNMVAYRLGGGIAEAFAFQKGHGIRSLSQLTPGKFLNTPGLWVGLLFAGVFLAAAVRLRRYREPI
jgi:ABC-2 type transport system permease protein